MQVFAGFILQNILIYKILLGEDKKSLRLFPEILIL